MSEWCEFCRDHFPEDHFNSDDNHKIGAEYGPVGKELAEREASANLIADIKQICERVPPARGYCENDLCANPLAQRILDRIARQATLSSREE